MAELERLFTEFIEADLAGDAPDPREYIDRLAGEDREQLAGLIDAYYVDAPLRRWDAEAFRGSEAERLTDELDRSFRGRAGLWPVLLPWLRHRARIRREDLVTRLAQALGVGDRAEKVGSYYHEMEQGLLPAEGVSNRVLEQLGRFYDTSAAALRRAGRSLAEDVSPSDADAVFARTARPDERFSADMLESAPRADAIAPDRDEVDELFTGGEESP
jgi:hypothetical protein